MCYFFSFCDNIDLERGDIMSFSDNLKKEREKKGLTKAKMASLLNIPYTSYNNFENGREPKVTIMLKLANILDITLYDLIGNNGISQLAKSGELAKTLNNDDDEVVLLKKYRTLNTNDKELIYNIITRLSNYKKTEQVKEFITIEPPFLIPYYGKVASAGTGQYVFDDIPPEMIVIENTDENVKVNFAIGVNGDSMEPTFYDGQTVLVQKLEKINVGEIGIFMIDGEAFVKELGNGVLISHNLKYDAIKITEDTVCIGKVIGVR